MSTLDLAHFFDDRWEQDRLQHYYFLDTPAYKSLSTLAKHIVLKGHRGTGKTTLLRALDWRERLTNAHLGGVLGGDPFADHVLGCFLQIKLLPVDMLDIWLRDSNEQVKHLVIASYLRASWMVEVCAAVKGLQSKRRFASYADQIEDLSEVAESVWGWVPAGLKIAPPVDQWTITVEDLERIAQSLMRQLRNAAAIEIPSPERTVVQLELIELAGIFARAFAALASHVGRQDSSSPWTFRMCMDEGEFLSSEWARTVRTLIRETDAPVYLAVSVLHSLGNDTRATGASLSIDDREIIDLDVRTVEQMASLLDGILNARLQLIGMDDRAFDLQSFLGNPDLEELARVALMRSETPGARKYQANRGTDGEAQYPIRDHLAEIGAIPATSKSSRNIESAGYRKKKVAGYLHLLGSKGIDRPVYAGWRVAVNMADNSVRDFIRFMRYATEVWSRDRDELRAEDVAAFLHRRRLDVATQDRALDRLGARKLAAMTNTVVDPSVSAAIVKLLGEISHRADFYDDGTLRKPNATRISVRRPAEIEDSDPTFDTLLPLLEEAAAYGYIADLTSEGDVIICRMNRSFARYFGFSFWRPQYQTPVSFGVIRRAMIEPSSSPSAWIGRRRPRPDRAGTGRPVDSLPGFDELDWS